jgi:hypothetical protein
MAATKTRTHTAKREAPAHERRVIPFPFSPFSPTNTKPTAASAEWRRKIIHKTARQVKREDAPDQKFQFASSKGLSGWRSGLLLY